MSKKPPQEEKKVKVHTCLGRICSFEDLKVGRRYYSDDIDLKFFRIVPEKCKCKKEITREKADLFIERRKAFPIYRPDPPAPLDKEKIDEFQIAMPLNRAQTPRVDLITKADIERAYVDKQLRYVRHIEEIHKMTLSERAKLVVDFRPNPDDMYDKKGRLLPGRLLFAFG